MAVTPASDAAPSVDVEAVLARDAGGAAGLSRLQARVVALCAISSLFSSLAGSEYAFTTGRIETRCFIPECESSTEQSEFSPPWLGNAVPAADSGFDNCRRFANVTSGGSGHVDHTCPATLFHQNTTVTCEQYVYENTNTVVYSLGLACNEWQRSFIGSARMIGAFVSLPLAGVISDRWGRRTALVICAFNTAVIGTLRVFANTYIGFIASVFAEAALGAGATDASIYVLGVETVPVKYRVITGSIILTLSPIAQVVLSPLAWALPYWKHLTLAIYVPQLLTLSYIWIMPESLRWYLSKEKYVEAEAAVKQMAKINRKELSEKTLLELKQAQEYKKTKTNTEVQNSHNHKEPWLVVLVFQYKPVLLRVLSAPVWWITTVLIYHGLTLNAVHIAGNKYLNYALAALVDIPGFWTSALLLDRIGRKPVLIMCFWICAACQIIYIFMPAGLSAASLTVYLIGKYAISIVAASIYVYTSELYPTQYRHSLFGYTSMMGRIGHVIAPMTPALSTLVWVHLPFALFAGMALVSGLLVLLLPETRGCRLPDTMQEAADLGKTRKLLKPTRGYDNPTLEK